MIILMSSFMRQASELALRLLLSPYRHASIEVSRCRCCGYDTGPPGRAPQLARGSLENETYGTSSIAESKPSPRAWAGPPYGSSRASRRYGFVGALVRAVQPSIENQPPFGSQVL